MSKGIIVEMGGCNVIDVEEDGASVVEIILFSALLSIQRHFVIGLKNCLNVIILFRDILDRALKAVLQTFFLFGTNLGICVGCALEVVIPNDDVKMVDGEVEPIGDSVVVGVSVFL